MNSPRDPAKPQPEPSGNGDSVLDWARATGEGDRVVADLNRYLRRRRARRFGAAALAGLALAVGGIFWQTGRAPAAAPLPAPAPVPLLAVTTPQIRTLADGSVVELKAGAEIEVHFTPELRRVVLRGGEAHFAVAKNPARPFVVVAGDTEVRAVGTVFDVRRDGRTVTVSMVEGLVDVTGANIPPAEPQRLAAGQQVRVSATGRQTQTINVADTTSWTQGRLVFRDKPLADAVSEVNRYLTQKIVLAPGTPGDVPVSGVFLTGDRDAFVSAASELFQLTATTETDGSIRLATDKK